MKLTSETVQKYFVGCLFATDEEAEASMDRIVPVEGITIQVGFDPERLEKNKSDIRELLKELPDDFMADLGGGMSFLNMCMDRHGNHWGEHRNVEQLAILGMAIGDVKLCFPREVWGILPGSMPFFVVKIGE